MSYLIQHKCLAVQSLPQSGGIASTASIRAHCQPPPQPLLTTPYSFSETPPYRAYRACVALVTLLDEARLVPTTARGIQVPGRPTRQIRVIS